MNKVVLIALLLAALLVIAGCGNSATGNVPRAPPAPSGGGCGIAAPTEATTEATSAAQAAEAGTAL